MSDTIKIALIGLGQIARHHLAGIQSNEALELVAICDKNEERMVQWAKHNHLNHANQYTQLSDMLAHEDAQYIVIATPPDTHSQIIKEVIKYKRIPLVEKPIVPAHETYRTFSSKKSAEIAPYVIYHWQYAEEIRYLKQQIKAGEEIRRIYIDICDPYLTKNGIKNAIKKEHISKGDAWTDSGANALSYVAMLLDNDLSQASDIHIQHLYYVKNKPVDSICRFQIGQIKVFIHVNWGFLHKKTSRIVTNRATYAVNHTQQRVTHWHGFVFPTWHTCGNKKNRLNEHYINFYRSYEWGNEPSNERLAQSLHTIFHTPAHSVWKEYSVKRSLRHRAWMGHISTLLPFAISIALLALFFGYIYSANWDELSFFNEGWGDAKHNFSMMDFWVNALSALVGVIGTYLLYCLMVWLQHWFEDDMKVEYHDEVLREQYGNSYWQEAILNGTPFGVYYNPLFFDDKEVVIDDDPSLENKFKLDNFIRFQYFNIRSAHADDAFKNEPTIRLKGVETTDNQVVLHTHRANYLAHMLTNRAIDYKMNGMASLRKLFEYEPTLTPLEHSIFANHIGINALIRIGKGEEQYILLPQRGHKATISKHMITASVATRLKTQDYSKPLDPHCIQTLSNDVILSAMAINPDEWAALTQDKKIDIHTQLIGGGRDIYEAGKPTIFYLVSIPDLSIEEYKGLSFYHKAHFDEMKRIFAVRAGQLTLRDNKIHFKESFVKESRRCTLSHRTHIIKPEKNMLSLLWHYTRVNKPNKKNA